eukprot:10137_1
MAAWRCSCGSKNMPSRNQCVACFRAKSSNLGKSQSIINVETKEPESKTQGIKCPDCGTLLSRHELLTPPGCWQCYVNKLNKNSKNKKITMYKNINNLHNHHNSISYWWSKSVTSWSTCDLIGCINSIDLPSNWRDMSIK